MVTRELAAPAIALRQVVKTYPDEDAEQAILALDSVDLDGPGRASSSA